MRTAVAALALGLGGILVTAGTALAAFQVVHMTVTSGEPGTEVAIDVNASLLIGESQHSQLFLSPKDAYDVSPESVRCDEIAGATVVGELQWQAASVEFQGKTFPGFAGTGSFTVPDVATGIYVVSGINEPFMGCHPFALFGVGMELPDTATGERASAGGLLTLGGLGLLFTSLLLVRPARRNRVPGR